MDWKRGNITAISLWHLWRYSLVLHIYVAIMAMPQISGILGIYGIYGKYGIVPQKPGFNYHILWVTVLGICIITYSEFLLLAYA